MTTEARLLRVIHTLPIQNDAHFLLKTSKIIPSQKRVEDAVDSYQPSISICTLNPKKHTPILLCALEILKGGTSSKGKSLVDDEF